MSRSQIRSAEALKKMQERERELDREDDERREARRERIAAASASAIVALGRYDKTVAAVADATAEVGTAVRTLLAEDVDVDRAAALLELEAAEVRRSQGGGRQAGPRGEGQQRRQRQDRDPDERPDVGQAAAGGCAGRGPGRGRRTPDWLRPRGKCCGRRWLTLPRPPLSFAHGARPGYGCPVLWSAAVSGRGHGRFWLGRAAGRVVVLIAHRFALALEHGVEPWNSCRCSGTAATTRCASR